MKLGICCLCLALSLLDLQMASTTKHERPEADEPDAKKAKVENIEDSRESKLAERVVLNPADCDLDFIIEGNGLQGSAVHEQGFAYCWSGARANVGIVRGKYCFGCKIISSLPVDIEDMASDQLHVCRVGISRGDCNVGKLGETENSFGFGGTGKFSSEGKFLDYGEKFGIGDTIVCAVNLEDKPLASIGFSKNGKWLGFAKQFEAGPSGLGVVDSPTRKLQWESALYPHVLLKNVVVQLQFSVEDGLVPVEGYKPWTYAVEDGNANMGPYLSKPGECEVMMMVGLPASGKTTWAEKWMKLHPEKRYILLGTNLALEQMKVPGLLRKHNYGERFDRLMDKATGIFNTLLSRAAVTPRNYIIDQTNVYKNARKRKLKPFADFKKIAVVVFPRQEELEVRSKKRFKEMGKEVPADAVNEMLANYVLPTSKDMPGSDEYFDQVIFVELDRAESQKNLDEMKHALASAPKLNSSNSSLCSSKSPIQSSAGFSPQNAGPFAVTGGYRQSSYSHCGSSTYQRPGQVNFANEGASLRGSRGPHAQAYQSYQYPAESRGAAPPRTYSSYENFLPTRDTTHSGSYGGISSGGPPPYSRSNIEANTHIPGVASYPYGSSMVEPYPVGGARPMPFSYNTYSGNFNSIRGPGTVPQVARPPTYSLRPQPDTHGSPYGTPIARPPYGRYPPPRP